MTLTTAPGKVTKSPERRKIGEFGLADNMHLPKFGRVGLSATGPAPASSMTHSAPAMRWTCNCWARMASRTSRPTLSGGTAAGAVWRAGARATAVPPRGTLVELGFAFGRADRPFIRTVLGSGWPLPDIAPGEQLQQQRAGYSAAPTPWAISPATPTGACTTVPADAPPK